MTLIDFLSHLRGLDVQVRVEGDRLLCNAPPGVLTSELRNQISARKPELLAFLRDLTDAKPEPVSIPTVARGGLLPVSFAQQRLWFLDRLVPENPFYNVPSALRLMGELDVDALQRAISAIVERHEVLRGTFEVSEGQPWLRVHPPEQVPLPIQDLSHLPPTVREEEAERLATAETKAVFDLRTGPLLRAKLLRLDARDHILLLTLHHIVADGWSMGVLNRELAALYGTSRRGQPSSLPPLPIQYPDFAAWQRKRVSEELFQTQLGYWRERLAGLSPVDLPSDRPRSATPGFRGRTFHKILPASLASSVRELSRDRGATPFMTMLAGFQALLARYTGQPDVAIGSPIANRNHSDVEGLIGFFVNTLVLRTDVSGDPSFLELVDRARDTALGAYAHQDLPFERLVAELRPERNLGRNPFFQVVFAVQNAPRTDLVLEGLRVDPQPFQTSSTRFDLEVHVWEVDGAMHCVAMYSADLFDESTIQRLLTHYETLLREALKAPHRPIGMLSMLSAEEERTLRRWNATSRNYPRDTGLAELFAAHVEKTPEALAVRLGDETLTYAELDRRANRLAWALRGKGVRPGDRVGVHLGRSLELPVALLATVKAGAAYVPLDPEHPTQRTAWTLQDAGIQVVLTGPGTPLPVEAPSVLALHESGALLAECPDTVPPVSCTGDSVAYVMYTSGSTGQPKGVEVSHRNVVRLVVGTDYVQLGGTDAIAQLGSPAFDALTFELWGAWLNGGRVELIPQDVLLDPRRLADTLRRQGVTAMFVTASLFNEVLRSVPQAFAPVRQVLVGGEALNPAACRFALSQEGAGRLINGYGPTESTTFAVAGAVETVEEGARSIPLGRPIANTTAWILDGHLRPVPVGVVGELYLGGDGLAHGYHNRPALTAERFVPDPFAETPGARLYRTGDLCRYLPDGRIDFLGRVDHQVKIRGHRIELGEIEAALSEHPAVAASAVVARDDLPSGRGLVAYVVPDLSRDAESAEVKASTAQAQVEHWRGVFDQSVYKDAAATPDPRPDFTGWISSYTDAPIPEPEMREWLEDTLEQLRPLPHSRVLELGCGTGMLLFGLAPGFGRYTGLDISDSVLARLQERVAAAGIQGVSLRHGAATDLQGVEPGSAELVLLNSVVQYFPSVDYLIDVIERVLPAVADGGAIFLGDLRSLPLLETFQASVVLHRSAGEESRQAAHRRVRDEVTWERELAVDPALFEALRTRFPRIQAVRVRPKSGRAHNELTGYRYSAILQVSDHPVTPRACRWQAWSEGPEALALLREELAHTTEECLGFRGIPNARLQQALAARALLADPTGPETVEAIRTELASRTWPESIEPQDLIELGTELGFAVELSWLSADARGTFDVVFRRGADRPLLEPIAWPGEARAPRAWASYANDPLRGAVSRRLMPLLKAHLSANLPPYMVPPSFVFLDQLPRTSTGKVDRARLPPPEWAVRERATEFVPPRTVVEAALARIWSELLGVPAVGVNDDFFELGGHSLLATQLASRVGDVLGTDVPLRWVFEAPTIARLAERFRSAPTPEERGRNTSIPRVSRDAELPLSYAQERLWFLDRLFPGNAFYNMPAHSRLRGQLDVAALRRALQEIVRRHEALRTRFVAEDGSPRPRIDLEATLEVPRIDLTGLPPEARRAEVERLAHEETWRPFDLEKGPLLRATLIAIEPQEHVLLLTMLHIVSDGWSLGVLNRELALLYEAFAADRPSPLPPLPIQYADFAVWQRRWMESEGLEEQLAYWRRQLSGLESLELPLDRPRPATPDMRGSFCVRPLPKLLSERITELGRRHGSTLFMTLLGAFSTLLSRYSGQDDIAIGTPIANRNRGEIEGLIGFFVNSLVMRCRLDGDPTFEELLGRMREVALGAYEHQDLPFERLVEELQPARDLRKNPLFQVMFAVQNAPMGTLKLGGLHIEPFPLEVVTARMDLELNVWEGRDGLTLLMFYSTRLFDEATIQALLEQLERLLSGMVEAPNRRLSQYALGTEPARPTPRPPPPLPEATLFSLFERQASLRPEATALVEGETRVTYAALERRARQLARRLRAHGVRRGDRVALYLEPSAELIAGILAVLRVGGTYVPLDPAYPGERVRFILEDCGAAKVLTTRALREKLPASRTEPLELDVPDAAESSPGNDPAPVPVYGEDGAYIIYTSGSTGQPKGVRVTHANVVRLFESATTWFPLGPEQVWTLFHSPAFDFSVWEMWGALLHGGRLVIVPYLVARSPREFHRLLTSEQVTVLNQTPSAFQQLARADEELGGSGLEALRWVIFGGEALDFGSLVPWFERRGDRQPTLVNMYGITETTVHVTWRPVTLEDARRGGSLIGQPLADLQLHVLDAQGRPTAIGEPGELYVGGAGVSQGYLGRPELTATRFVPDPFSGIPGARLYRSGDRARRRSDGELEFIGRIDGQVKLRGYRIELGEIEAALRTHPSVADVAVSLHGRGGEDARLVAYVVSREDALVPEALRTHLRTRLPEYMIPSAWVPLEALPLTPHGKLDRRALPEPRLQAEPQAGGSSEEAANRTPTEQVLAGLWTELLGLQRAIGRRADFFSLGGHSLLTVRMLHRLEETFGVTLPLQAIFEDPSLEGLAARIDAAKLTHQALPPLIRAQPDAGPAPLSHAQERVWFLEQLAPGNTAYNVPMALRLEGELDVSALERGLSELVRRHEALRTVVQSRQGVATQEVRPATPLKLPCTDLSSLSREERELRARALATEEAARPFNLEKGPLFRVQLLRLSSEDHVLLVGMSHLVCDGVSQGVFLRELAALYEAFKAGQPSPLPELPLSFGDYARWQREWLRGKALDSLLGFWREELKDLPTVELPTDRPPPPIQTWRGAAVSAALPAELSERLRALGQAEGATSFMTLLALFEVVLHRWTGQEDLVVGTPIANRERKETQGVVGFFANTLVLRTRLEGRPSFREVLRRVRSGALRAYAHQDLPFEKLVEELQPERDPSRNPLFQILFALHRESPLLESWDELTVKPLPFDIQAAKLALELHVTETSQGLSLYALFNTDLFDDSTILRLLEHLSSLAAEVCARPDAPIGRLAMLSPEERLRLVAGNAPQVPRAPGLRLHDLLTRQFALTPDAIAVELGGQQLTYAELDRRSADMAKRLRALGVGPNVRVGIHLERSLELMVSLVATLRAGGAYVPLEPSLPRDRLAFMIEDSEVAVILAPASAELPTGAATRLDPLEQGEAPAAVPAHEPDEEDLAYAIYTSGSTGRPKGAMNTHRAIVNRLLWMQEALGLTETDAVLQKTPIGFDVSVWELFWPLMTGARLVLAPPGAHTDAARLAALVRDHAITTLHFVPSMLHFFLEEPGLGRPAALRNIVCSGEALGAELRDRCLKALPKATLWNLYGPTEAAVDVTWWRCAPEDQRRFVPIGRPIANLRLYVLDAELEPVPVGCPGELYIAGVGLARGYLGRADLTASSFLPDPFSPEPGGRMYRTGDIGAVLPDGSLRYLGRRDHQVKVRGVRIELEELQSVLSTHPDVRDAVALALDAGGAEARLVAWYRPKDPARKPDAEALRDWLLERLPEPMVPSTLLPIEQYPVTNNGKLDRRALLAEAGRAPRTGPRKATIPPRTPEEKAIAGILAELLGVEQVGVKDDFFELGGHSLLALQLLERVRKEFGRTLPLAAIFQAPTVEGMAKLLKDDRGGLAFSPLVPIRAKGRGEPLFCPAPVVGIVFPYFELASLLKTDRPIYGLQPRGLDGREPAHRTIEEMAAWYVDAIKLVQPRGPYHLCGWSFGGLVAFEMARQLKARGEQVARLVLLDTPSPSRPSLRGLATEGRLLWGIVSRHLWTYLSGYAALRLLGKSDAPEVKKDSALWRDLFPKLQQLVAESAMAPVIPEESRVLMFQQAEMDQLFRVFLSSAMASARYRGGSYGGPMYLIRASEDADPKEDQALGWTRIVRGQVHRRPVSGSHMTLLRAPHVQEVAAVLDEVLRPREPASKKAPEATSSEAGPHANRRAS
ncbi:non-ribosomal peptide synthetase [Hyalangium gracile]|uniref:non-ribosomal peptide synthetase n=1 Tax=Hyalangium gracile TaxID=394092 RepID=UPI0021E17647|nr:non-ribosomal peptide synthetase [Hyalangium gracile]